ncbi:UPF0607 protein [Plecturocebus cupreus]
MAFSWELERPTAGPASFGLEAPAKGETCAVCTQLHDVQMCHTHEDPLSKTQVSPPTAFATSAGEQVLEFCPDPEDGGECRRRARRTNGGGRSGRDPAAAGGERGPCSNEGAASTSRLLETQGNLTSFNCSPRALKGNVHSRSLTEINSTDKAQVPAVSFHSKDHGVPSAHSPAGGLLPFGKPDPTPAVLPDPVPGCSHWPEKAASEVLGKDHLPSSSGLQMGGRRPSARILQLLQQVALLHLRLPATVSDNQNCQGNPSSCHWSLPNNGGGGQTRGRHLLNIPAYP